MAFGREIVGGVVPVTDDLIGFEIADAAVDHADIRAVAAVAVVIDAVIMPAERREMGGLVIEAVAAVGETDRRTLDAGALFGVAFAGLVDADEQELGRGIADGAVFLAGRGGAG